MKISISEKSYQKIGIGFVIFILALLVFTAMLKGDGKNNTTAIAFSDIVYIKEFNIYTGFFTEPFETLLLIFKNGDGFAISTHNEHGIYVPFGWLEGFLKRKHREIKDIIIIIHNHKIPTSFTPGNMYYYRKFKEAGFEGHFQIYYTFDGRVRTLEKKESKIIINESQAISEVDDFSYTEIRLDNYKNSLWKWSMAIRRAIKRLEKNGFAPALPIAIHLTEDWEIEKAVIYYRRPDGS